LDGPAQGRNGWTHRDIVSCRNMSESLLPLPEPDDWLAGLDLDGLTVQNRLAIANEVLVVAENVLRERGEPRPAAADSVLRARLIELEHAQQIKDQLVATVSHELRTPLAAIGGYVDLLLMGTRGPLNAPQLQDLQRIHRAYEHLLHIVNDLLSYHRLMAGQFTFDIADVSIDDALASVAELVAPQAAERGVTLEIARTSPAVIAIADHERVRQILVNLVGNAIKFTAQRGVVRLRARVDEPMAVVEVEDTGIGIPEESLETIFRPFTQLPSEVAASGAGLGLAISRDMARGMGGELSVTSAVGEGSCFVLRLPISTSLAARKSR
jgi:signal transduction histidine kinase